MDVHKFAPKLNIKSYMSSNPVKTNGLTSLEFRHSGLSNASLFNPPGALDPSLKVFRDVVLRDLDKLPVKRVRTNMDMSAGLDSLCKKNLLFIRPADKGGGIVVLDRKDYMSEMYRILGDTDTYTLLPSDPRVQYLTELNTIVQRGLYESILDKKEKQYLIPSAPRTPIVYYLPKLHKNLNCPPGHPVVSGIDSLTPRVVRYINLFCSP